MPSRAPRAKKAEGKYVRNVFDSPAIDPIDEIVFRRYPVLIFTFNETVTSVF